MSSGEELSFRALNEKRGGGRATPPSTTPMPVPPGTAGDVGEAATEPKAGGLPFDPWRLLGALAQQWHLILLAGAGLAVIGFGLGALRFKTLYTGSANLIRQELPNTLQASETGEAFKPKQLTPATLVSVLRSPSLMKNVGAETTPVISPGILAQKLTISPERNTDVIRIEFEGWVSAEATANVLSTYCDAAVNLTRELQAQEAKQVNSILTHQLESLDKELSHMAKTILEFSREAKLISADKETDAYLHQLGDLTIKYETMRIDYETIDLKLEALQNELAKHNPAAAKLKEARMELDNLLVKYTEANPVVAEQREKIAGLEKDMEASAKEPANDQELASGTAGTSLYLEIVALRAQKQTLAQQLAKLSRVRDDMQEKLSAIPEKSVQLARLKAQQLSMETARSLLSGRQREAQMYAEQAPGYYRVLATPNWQDVGVKSRWPKVLLATIALGAMGAMGATLFILGREILDDRVKTPADLSRVTGLPLILRVPPFDGVPGEESRQWAFQAWTHLVRPLKMNPDGGALIGLRAEGEGAEVPGLGYRLADAALQRGHNVVVIASREPDPSELNSGMLRHDLSEVLSEPRKVFAGVDPAGSWLQLLVMDRNWRWSREHRQQWNHALQVWRSVRSLVVLLEAPTGVQPDDLLMSETIANLVYVVGEGADGGSVRENVEALLGGGCQPVGAIFQERKRRGAPGLLRRFGVGAAACFFALTAWGEPEVRRAQPADAAWNDRLTLGPGDSVNITIFGRDGADRDGLVISPDGKLSYMEAHDVQAAGLTIDELRDALDKELRKYYRNVRAIVTPGEMQSKKYYILGKVVDKGAFTLDRPLTILEAVARSRGLETGLFEKNTVELADLPRSFLVRGGKRMPVDFEKLFAHGDMSQNVALQPGDYIYFPSANVNEVYVLGSIKSPGVQGITPNATVVSMITLRGGFTDLAYSDHVLVVRGSMSHPETFVVNVRKVLQGKGQDFRLQPKDIVFVSDKPWARAEELLDIAVRTFMQAAASGWASQNVGPLITAPIVPSLR